MWENYQHRDSVWGFVDQVEQLNPRLIVLFGSVAQGEYTEGSDADVLAVFDSDPGWNAVYACSDGWVQPISLSLEDLRARLADGASFFHEIVEDGILLLGDARLWGELTAAALRTQRLLGMTRCANAWTFSRS